MGPLTYRLVRDAVDVEPVEPLELKGKAERVPAYRLVGLRAGKAASARGRWADGWTRCRAGPSAGDPSTRPSRTARSVL